MTAPTDVVDVTLSLDTSQYASGDLIADTQVVRNALNHGQKSGVLHSITVIDKDDQGAAFYVYVLNANVTFGTENNAPSISDADAANIMGYVSVGTGDYQDLGGAKVAYVGSLGIPIKAIDDSRDIAISVVNGTGTPTYSASGVILRLGILRDYEN
jgi:hypothetical protein